MATSWREMTERSRQRADSNLSIISAETADNIVRISMRNTGAIRLADFDQCDLIIHYYNVSASYQIAWLPHESIAEGPARWEVLGIYSDAATLTPEVYEPGILNPTEEIILRTTLASSVQLSTTLMAVFSTPSGATASMTFTGG
ncbi:MAG: hypothetical protein U9R48_06995 [Chloroflexota bacterium]|nr:hypothetical protein [Chloroflexota bacterium]